MGKGTACATEKMTMLAIEEKMIAMNARLRGLEEKLDSLHREIRLNRWLLVFGLVWLTFLKFLP